MAGQQHPASLLLRGENGLRNHAVDPLGAIDHLGDVIIHPTSAGGWDPIPGHTSPARGLRASGGTSVNFG